MRNRVFRIKAVLAILLSVLTIPHFGMGAEIDQPDDFEAGADGWDGAGPVLIDTGGPMGDGDAFIQLQAFGGNRPGSRLGMFNFEPDWIGDYSGVGSVEMDLWNPVETGEDLSIRLVLFGPESTNNRWTSVTPEIIAADGQWTRVSFPVAEDQLVSVFGDSTYDQVLSDVVRVMIRHDAGEASVGGDRVVAKLGVDNIVLRAVPEPATATLTLAAFAFLVVIRCGRPS